MGKYSPIYSSVWNDEALEGTPFEVHAFFVYLWSNDRVRPSGIYRATDEQLSVDSHVPIRRVREYLEILQIRGRIVRDGAWVFVRGYLARQPNHANLLKAVQREIAECGSKTILEAFSQRYPLRRQWSDNRLATVGEPMNEFRHQSSTEQSRAEHKNLGAAVRENPNRLTRILPDWIATLPFPAQPEAWWAELLATFPGLDHEAVARDGVAYWAAHKAKYRDLRAFMRNQFSRAFARQREAGRASDPYADLPCAWECPTCGGVHEGLRDGPRPACPISPPQVVQA